MDQFRHSQSFPSSRNNLSPRMRRWKEINQPRCCIGLGSCLRTVHYIPAKVKRYFVICNIHTNCTCSPHNWVTESILLLPGRAVGRCSSRFMCQWRKESRIIWPAVEATEDSHISLCDSVCHFNNSSVGESHRKTISKNYRSPRTRPNPTAETFFECTKYLIRTH